MQLAAFLYVVKLPLGNRSSKMVCEETACQNTANPSEKHILPASTPGQVGAEGRSYLESARVRLPWGRGLQTGSYVPGDFVKILWGNASLGIFQILGFPTHSSNKPDLLESPPVCMSTASLISLDKVKSVLSGKHSLSPFCLRVIWIDIFPKQTPKQPDSLIGLSR